MAVPGQKSEPILLKRVGPDCSAYLLDMTYPVVSSICFPHIEQRPFLKAQPIFRARTNQHSTAVIDRYYSPWQYFALFCVTGDLQSLHFVAYGCESVNHEDTVRQDASFTGGAHTEYLLFELEPPAELGPAGLPMSLLSPTFREPSFIAEELEVNGSGAAILDNF